MAGKFATQTTVSVEKTKAEIETLLRKYGATSFASGWDRERAVIQFDAHERRVRLVLPLPNRNDREITHTIDRYDRPKARTAIQADAYWEQLCRSSWRSLKLLVQAMLEAVEAEIVTFEEAFLPYLVLPSGQSVFEAVEDDVHNAYQGLTFSPMFALGRGA